MKFTKVWGTTEEIHPCVWLMDIDEGGFSSDHSHADAVNKFTVISGILHIVSKPIDSGEEITQVLRAGDSIAVPQGVLHRFECVEQCICIESYFKHDPGYEITRNNVGGVKNQ